MRNLLSKLVLWWVSFSVVSLFKNKNNSKPNSPKLTNQKKQKTGALSLSCWRDGVSKDISTIFEAVINCANLGNKKFDTVVWHYTDRCVVKVFLLDPPESRFEDLEGKDGIPFFEAVIVSCHCFSFSAIGRSGTPTIKVECYNESTFKEQLEGAFLHMVSEFWLKTPQAKKTVEDI